MKISTVTGVCLRIKQAGDHQTVFHVLAQLQILNIRYHRKKLSATGNPLKTPDTDTGRRSSASGNNMMIQLADDHLDITKIEMVMKGAGTVHQKGHDHKIALRR